MHDGRHAHGRVHGAGLVLCQWAWAAGQLGLGPPRHCQGGFRVAAGYHRRVPPPHTHTHLHQPTPAANCAAGLDHTP
jgi:hypothetical protein